MNEINFDDFHKHILHAENYLNYSRESWDKSNKVEVEPSKEDDNISIDSVHDEKDGPDRSSRSVDNAESTIFFASDLPHIKPWEPYNFQQKDQSLSRYGDSLDTPLIKSNDTIPARQGDNSHSESLIAEPNTPPTMKYLKSRGDLVKEAKDSFRATHSFKPTVAAFNNTSMNGLHNSLYLPTRSSSNKRHSRTSAIVNKISKPPVAAALSHRIEELHASHKSRQEELNRQRREMELLELSHCSFTPTLSRGTQELISRRRRTNEAIDRYYQQHASDTDLPLAVVEDVSQRLHDDAEIRQNQRIWLEAEVKRQRDAQTTFQPSINPTPNPSVADGYSNLGSPHNNSSVGGTDRVPIHLRIYELQSDKQKHLKELATAIETSQQKVMTFHPKIDSRSRVMAERRQVEQVSTDYDLVTQRYLSPFSEVDVGARLTSEGKKQARRLMHLKEESEKSLFESMQQPEVCKGTKKMAETNPLIRYADCENSSCRVHPSSFYSANFAKRSEMIRERKERRDEERRRAEADKYNSWFQPQIYSDARSIIADKRPELLSESEEDRYHRMIHEHQKVKDNHIKATEKVMYGEATFTPTIDPLSRALGRDSNVDELYENLRGKSWKEHIRLKNEAIESAECSFHPHINSVSRSMVEGMNGIENVAENLRYTSDRVTLNEPEKMARNIRLRQIEKEESRRAELIARELQELKECTFHPTVRQYRPIDPSESGPIVVRGLGRHLELKHLSKQQKEEAIQREKDAFSVKNVEKYRRAEDGSTIVQSFRFHQMHCGTK